LSSWGATKKQVDYNRLDSEPVLVDDFSQLRTIVGSDDPKQEAVNSDSQQPIENSGELKFLKVVFNDGKQEYILRATSVNTDLATNFELPIGGGVLKVIVHKQ